MYAGTEKPYFVEVHGGFLYWTKCKPDGESRSGHTRVVVLSGADVAGDPEGVRITLPVPDGTRRSSLGAATNCVEIKPRLRLLRRPSST